INVQKTGIDPCARSIFQGLVPISAGRHEAVDGDLVCLGGVKRCARDLDVRHLAVRRLPWRHYIAGSAGNVNKSTRKIRSIAHSKLQYFLDLRSCEVHDDQGVVERLDLDETAEGEIACGNGGTNAARVHE